MSCYIYHIFEKIKNEGLVRDLNPGPLAPEARIIPLDQRADILKMIELANILLKFSQKLF
jgi:hypothetical protein